jgi:hypothetical protein
LYRSVDPDPFQNVTDPQHCNLYIPPPPPQELKVEISWISGFGFRLGNLDPEASNGSLEKGKYEIFHALRAGGFFLLLEVLHGGYGIICLYKKLCFFSKVNTMSTTRADIFYQSISHLKGQCHEMDIFWKI